MAVFLGYERLIPSVLFSVSPAEFLVRALRLHVQHARAGAAVPVSLQVSLTLEQIRALRPFSAPVERMADKVIGEALNLELALDEGADPQPTRAATLAAIHAFSRGLARSQSRGH